MLIRKATIADVPQIIDLLKPFFKSGVVIERSHEEIVANIDTFLVAEKKVNKIVGVVSWYSYGKMLQEVRSLAVTKSEQSKGTGKALVTKLVEHFHENGYEPKIFALTIAPKFFIKTGFKVVEKDTLPEKIWKDCSKCIKQDCCDEIAVVFDKGA